MGALISLYLAADATDVAGVILYSPAIMLTDPGRHFLPILKHIMPSILRVPGLFLSGLARQMRI